MKELKERKTKTKTKQKQQKKKLHESEIVTSLSLKFEIVHFIAYKYASEWMYAYMYVCMYVRVCVPKLFNNSTNFLLPNLKAFIIFIL